jgi:hypothetical protein
MPASQPANQPLITDLPRVTLRLVDGSHPDDWNPRHGDRPCHWNGHDGTHPLDGCPDLYAAMEGP